MASVRAHVIKRDSNKFQFLCEFVPEISTELRARLSMGVELSADDLANLPTGLTIGVTDLPGQAPPSIIHYSSAGGPWIVSEVVKTYLEQLEPSTHCFVPINVRAINYSTEPAVERMHSNYYLLVLTKSLDCVEVEKTGIPTEDGRLASVGEIVGEVGVCTLRASVVGDSHLWRGAQRHRSTIFISDLLYRWFKTEGITGVRSTLACEFM